jgi:hypothetical protein
MTTVVKGKMDVRFPALVQALSPVLVDKTSGIYTFSFDMDALIETLATVFQPTIKDQHVTSAGPVAVSVDSGIVRVDQTVGASITLTLPAASAKTCPVLISDWKGDAGTNNITITLAGAETFPGGLTSWKIAADTGSLFLRPISGVGYVL